MGRRLAFGLWKLVGEIQFHGKGFWFGNPQGGAFVEVGTPTEWCCWFGTSQGTFREGRGSRWWTGLESLGRPFEKVGTSRWGLDWNLLGSFMEVGVRGEVVLLAWNSLEGLSWRSVFPEIDWLGTPRKLAAPVGWYVRFGVLWCSFVEVSNSVRNSHLIQQGTRDWGWQDWG